MIYSIIISSIYASVTELNKTKGFWVFQGCAAVDGKKKGTKHASTNSPTAWEILEKKGILRELF